MHGKQQNNFTLNIVTYIDLRKESASALSFLKKGEITDRRSAWINRLLLNSTKEAFL